MRIKTYTTILAITTCVAALTLLMGWTTKTPVINAAAVQTSVSKAFALLQASGAQFTSTAKCASCHHNTLTSMIAKKAVAKGMSVPDSTAGMRVFAMMNTLYFVANPNLNNQFVTAKFLAPYILLGLHAEKYPADFNTDISVDYLLSQALPDGSFKAEYNRVPLECGDIHLTALSIRAISVYAATSKKTQVQSLISRTRTWLEQQHPKSQQEIAFQLLGMQWCGSTAEAKKEAANRLVEMQHDNGGWSQLPTMAPDAYATGQALYALAESGIIAAKDLVMEKGIAYLLTTQNADGSWLVLTRSNPIQPFFNSGFPPRDENQFISAAATSWATLALLDALPDKP